MRGWRGRALASEARWMASVGAVLLVPPLWVALGGVHSTFDALLSRSHFRFCRIRYPLEEHDQHEEIGYLVYLKLSLTGNEGEFIRRLKLDEPSFPHHPTANQFFTEVQFEAYRALGEHVGDKMFLPSITGVGDDLYVNVEAWFFGLGSSFLDPLP